MNAKITSFFLTMSCFGATFSQWTMEMYKTKENPATYFESNWSEDFFLNINHDRENNKSFLYVGLDGKREWQIKVAGDNAYKIAWHEMFSNAGVKHYDEQYNYLSSLSHPSNLSVIQFKQMYEGSAPEDRADYQSMRVMLNTSKTIMSFLLRDYITYFNLHSQFDELPLIDQMLVSANNKTFRGEEYVLNNTLEKLN